MYCKYFKSGFILLSFLISASATAGVVFTAPLKGPDPIDDEFPESHFGSGPMRETSHGYAAREVNDMESPDEESGKRPIASRGIASLGDNPNSGVAEPAIVTSQSVASQDIPQSVVSRKGVQEVSVIASDLGYFPKTIFVSRDVPVRMYVTGASKNTLCIMMDSFQVRKQVKSQRIEEITFVPNVPGKYRFYCPVNGMEGNLVVKELSSVAQQDDQAAPQAQAASAEATVHPTTATDSHRVPAGGRNVPQVTAGWQSAVDHNNFPTGE